MLHDRHPYATGVDSPLVPGGILGEAIDHVNAVPNGGDKAFNAHGNENSTLATDLHFAGFKTAMMGEYLDRYHMSSPRPPGWTEWDVADWGYPEFNYILNENGKVVHCG